MPLHKKRKETYLQRIKKSALRKGDLAPEDLRERLKEMAQRDLPPQGELFPEMLLLVPPEG